MTTLRFLLLEDKLQDTEVIQATLTKGGVDFKLRRVGTRADFVAALETQAFDLILAAYATPGFDGMAALEIARDRAPDVPFIFVSASLGEELAIESLKRGATDYVLKQRLERLVPCVQRALREARERRDRQRAERMLIEQKQLLERIASGQPLDDCLAAVCAAVSRLSPRIRACFLLTDAQRLMFKRSITPDFLPSFGQGLQDAPINELAIGTCGTAVYCGKPVTCADIAHNDHWAQEWRDLCLAHGILACHSVPVFSVESLPLGSLMLCLGEARTPTDWECQLAEFGAQVASLVFERDRSNLALRQNEARLRAVAANLPSGAVFVVDHDFRYLLAEGNALREAGMTSEDLVGKTLWEALDPAVATRYEPYYRQALGGEPFSLEHCDYDHNYISHGTPLRNDRGDVDTVLVVSHDISDRKRIELNAEFLADVSQSLVEAINVDEIVQTVGEQLHRYLKTSLCAFVEINETQDKAAIHYDWHQADVPSIVGVHSLPEFVTDEFLQAAKAGQPIVVRDVTRDPRIVDPQRYVPLKIGAEINVPLIRDGEWKFSLVAFHQAPHNWRTDEIELMRELAIRIWNRLERTRAETALRESEARLRFMLNASQIGEWDLDLTTQPYTAHRSLRHDQIFGYESLLPDWSYEIFLTHVHPDDRAAVNDKFQQTLSASTDWNFECRIIHPDQSLHWIWVRSSVYCDPNGTPSRLLGMVMDISDRKQAEAALRKSEEQSQNILESITDGFFALDQDWRFTYVNPQGERLLNRTPGDLLGQVIWEVYPGTVGTEFERAYRQTASERVASSFISFYPDHNCWYEVYAYPATDGITVYFRDVTDRLQAEAALRESEERFRTLADQMSQFAWMADANGWIFWYNRRWFEYTGTTLEEMQGWGWRQVHHPEHVDRVVEHFRHCIEIGEQWEDTFPLRSKDSTYRWFLSRAIPIRDAAGNILRWFGTNTDITERLQAEQEREQLLEREQAAREESERANRIKDEFLAVLSHELRSPLNPILGWTRLMQTGKLDTTRQAEALRTIERNAKLQSQLIEDLLDISRIMQGKLSLTAAPVSLTFVISAALETVRLAAETKTIQITLDLEPIAPIFGDAARLQQVVWNLLTNAVKFTPNGGQITVELSQINHLAQIRVMDTGKGINADFLPYVFEYFRQEDGSTTRRFGGLGLGLAIVRQIVEMHGGTVRVESQGENQGATFIVQLPTLQQATPTLPELTHPEAASVETPLKGVQVLLVDDDTDTRDFQAFLLEQNGAEVTVVASGSEALQVLGQVTPDVLVSDVGMAEMDGYMLIQQIRNREASRSNPRSLDRGMMPAIAVTAYAAELDQQKALQAGFQAHITKPVEPEILVSAIISLLKPN